jgi:uncharacterized protein (DUF2384 family)
VFNVGGEQTVAELREQVRRELIDLFEGDETSADLWLSSPIRVLGDRTPISVMETKSGVQKIRNVIRKWQEGTVS